MFTSNSHRISVSLKPQAFKKVLSSHTDVTDSIKQDRLGTLSELIFSHFKYNSNRPGSLVFWPLVTENVAQGPAVSALRGNS